MNCSWDQGIEIIKAIQAYRTPFWDDIFIFLNYFDTQLFAFVLIPIIWIGYKKVQGIHIFYLFLLSVWINTLLKSVFTCSRPFDIDPALQVLFVGGDSFPSGAAQTSFLLGALLIYSFRKKWWAWLIGINYIAWIGFSRMYLGVHFPKDIIGGWSVGLILFLLDVWLFKRIFQYMHKQTSFHVLMISVIIPVMGFVLVPSKFASTLLMVILVVSLGVYISDINKIFVPASKSRLVIIFRSIAVIGGVFLLYAILQALFHSIYMNAVVLGLWISVIAPWLCMRVPLLKGRA